MDIGLIILIILAGVGILILFINIFSKSSNLLNKNKNISWHKQNMQQHIAYLSSLKPGETPKWWRKSKNIQNSKK